MQNIFDDIYRGNAWGHAETRSGSGSSLFETEQLRKYFPIVLQKLEVKTVFDFGCGDCNWIFTCLPPDVDYVGTDASPSCVSDNRQKFPNKVFLFFHHYDEIPKADLILCKDVFVHLPLAEIASTVQRFKASGSKFLACTHFMDSKPGTNTEIKRGEWRPLNMNRPPFNWPAPILTMREAYPEKRLAVWNLAAIP